MDRRRAPTGRPPARNSGVSTYLHPPAGAIVPRIDGGFEYLRRGFAAGPGGRGLLRAWGDPDDPWVIGVEPGRPRWRITAWGAGPAEARAAARMLFALDDPIGEFYRAVRREPVLRGTERRFRGLRLPRDGSIYESLVHAVIAQQLSVAVATTLERRLVALAGDPLLVDGVEVPRLPGPRALRAMAPERLRSTGLSRAKVTALRGIADAWQEGLLAPSTSFAAGPADSAIARLDALPGVGRWTAENALLRGAGRRDLFLAGDLGLRSALAAYGALPREAPEEEARAWGDRWYPGWGSYATLYLWRRWTADRRPATVRPRRRPAAPPPSADGPRRTAGARSRRG